MSQNGVLTRSQLKRREVALYHAMKAKQKKQTNVSMQHAQMFFVSKKLE